MDLSGVFCPIVTPFASGTVATDRLIANLRRWASCGLRGYVVLGSSGETVLLNEEEKIAVIRTAAEHGGNKLIVAGTGCESTQETIDLTRRAAEAGAEAALVVTPSYYKSHYTDLAYARYFEQVAEASPIPVIVYNVPKFTGVDLSWQVIASLAQHPNIAGIKDSTDRVAKLSRMLSETADHDFQVLVGSYGLFLPGLQLGAPGAVLALANVAAQACVEIYRRHLSGDHASARSLFIRLLPVAEVVVSRYGVPGIKVAMDLCGYFGGEPRSPVQPLGEEAVADLRASLAGAGLLPERG